MALFTPHTVAGEVRRRKISLLLHSTHLFTNLPHIIEDGTIDTLHGLEERYGREKALRLLHDPRRYETFAVGRDYINCSLTFPNVELLYHRSKSEWKGDWVHLALDVSLLAEESSRFSPVSAAADFGKNVQSGVQGFRGLFAERIEKYDRAGLSSDVPTHPQAEVLLHGPLPLDCTSTLIVPTEETALEVSRLLSLHKRTVPVEVLPHLFVWPKRLMK